ncbi:hypothetical protein JOL62DRAFT_234261 [Phyllosticta paracitricarpa]|uniref:Uncharacterized protein n=2 Tax=Phyllosticta TaxID=121621 RepID=A0ABR1LQY2_9PEZI
MLLAAKRQAITVRGRFASCTMGKSAKLTCCVNATVLDCGEAQPASPTFPTYMQAHAERLRRVTGISPLRLCGPRVGGVQALRHRRMRGGNQHPNKPGLKQSGPALPRRVDGALHVGRCSCRWYRKYAWLSFLIAAFKASFLYLLHVSAGYYWFLGDTKGLSLEYAMSGNTRETRCPYIHPVPTL